MDSYEHRIKVDTDQFVRGAGAILKLVVAVVLSIHAAVATVEAVRTYKEIRVVQEHWIGVTHCVDSIVGVFTNE